MFSHFLFAIKATHQVLCVGFQTSDDMNRLLGVFHLRQKAMMHGKNMMNTTKVAMIRIINDVDDDDDEEHRPDDDDGIPPLYQHNLQQQ